MEQFCQGDETAFDALFERHAPAVRGYLARLVGSAALADDLTQTTFLSLVRARGRFLKGARFKPWLYAIATNAARDSKRRRTESLTPKGELPADEGEEMAVRDFGMERQVHAALKQLPDSQREAILQHRFHGLSFAEIAVAEGVTESAVKVRAHRGYERLRELLKGLWP
jgi:RNA polymerase sigma factor (sigma-70 family)